MFVEVETLFEGCAIDCPKFETITRQYFVNDEIVSAHECANLICCRRIMEYLKKHIENSKSGI